MSRVLPPPSDEAQPFWEATREGRFLLPWCTDCGRPFWYPRSVCPACLGSHIEWREASGLGTVHAVSVMHLAALPEMQERVPYAVVLVDLDEGARMMSNVFGCDADEVAVGLRVRVGWEDLDDGRRLPVFAPA